MKNHIKEYMIHCSDLKDNIEKFNMESIFTFDTESCFINEELKRMYEQKEVKQHEGYAVHVYSWGLSNTSNDYVLYGENLTQFFESINYILFSRINLNQKLSEGKVKQFKKALKMKIFIHNLAWDIEFLKYWLLDNEYDYYNSKVKDKKKINEKHNPNTFNIVENNNIVYSANVNMKPITVSYRKKIQKDFYNIKQDLFCELELLDSVKIMPQKLEEIGKKVISIDEKFNKLGDTYDYDSVREEGHTLTEKEKMYLYNDVYILKEFIKQVYLPLNTKQTTASGIAFESFIVGKYGDDKPYKQFLEDYPDLYDFKYIWDFIKKSYVGGWTQANSYFKGKHLKNINGTSIDINSSYPSNIKDKPLPYGIPTLHDGYVTCSNKELNLLRIGFNQFYNKHENNYIGVIQCQSINSKIFNCIGTEYIHTNIIDGKPHGTNGRSEKYRYELYIWEFELDNILENTIFEVGSGVFNYKGYDIDIIETLTFKSNIGHFGDVVQQLTDDKIRYKKEGNKPLTNMSKTKMNSFYGKLASNPDREERKVIKKGNIVKSENTEIIYSSEKKYYPAFASCVTAWGRCNLRSTLYDLSIDKEGNYHNVVIYWDTDSLYTTLPIEVVKEKLGVYAEYDVEGNLIKILNEDGKLDPYILGKWDIEKTYKEFKTIGSKKYIVKTHDDKIICKCAGLPEEVREKQTFESFKLNAVFEGKKVKTKVPGGYVLLEGTYQLKEFSYGGF